MFMKCALKFAQKLVFDKESIEHGFIFYELNYWSFCMLIPLVIKINFLIFDWIYLRL